MKNFIKVASTLFVLCFVLQLHTAAQKINTFPKIDKRITQTNFTPVSASIRAAALINVREIPKSLIPVPEKQYTVDFCSSGPESYL